MILPGRAFIRWKSSAASDAVGMTNLELVLIALEVLSDRQPAIREDDLPSFHRPPVRTMATSIHLEACISSSSSYGLRRNMKDKEFASLCLASTRNDFTSYCMESVCVCQHAGVSVGRCGFEILILLLLFFFIYFLGYCHIFIIFVKSPTFQREIMALPSQQRPIKTHLESSVSEPAGIIPRLAMPRGNTVLGGHFLSASSENGPTLLFQPQSTFEAK